MNMHGMKMVRTESLALALLKDGGVIRRAWGGFKIGLRSVLPKLVTQLEEAGKIKRIDDRTSRCGEEWALAQK